MIVYFVFFLDKKKETKKMEAENKKAENFLALFI